MIQTLAQRQATTTQADLALVIAGPGSGKTATIVARAQYLIESGTRPADIAIVTYTNAAARVIEQRVAAHSFGDVPGEPEADYECCICGTDNPDEPCQSRLGFVGTLHAFCLKHLSKYGHWKNGIRVLDEGEADDLLQASARDAGVRTTPTVMRVLTKTRRDWMIEKDLPETPARIAVRNYYFNMMGAGEFDYNSLLIMTLRLLSDPALPRRLWQHLIVDEFQDAAWIDGRIYENATAKNRFYVGDPMQSIFGFRGGDVREIDLLTKCVNWHIYELNRNWRSGPAICAAASKLATRASGGRILALESFSDTEATVETRKFQNEGTEALAIANYFWSEAGEPGPDKDESLRQLAGYAVLARTNHIAGKIADTLTASGVPIRRLVTQAEPEDWECAMACLVWLAMPEHKRKTGAGLDKLFPGMTGDADKMMSELKMMGASDESIARIKARFDELPVTADLADLHASLKLDRTQRKIEGEGVYAGTIHSAKGMEFDTVILAGFEDEVIPGHAKRTDVEEERRIAYVGMTRAKRRLLITWAQWRQETWGGAGPRTHTASRFILEAGL